MEKNMKVVIEDNIPIKRRGKYSEYYDILDKMKSGQSFLIDDYYVVDALRHYAWEKKIPLSFRQQKIAGEPLQYRIWRR